MIGEIIKAPKGTRNNAKGLVNCITGVTKSTDDAIDFIAAKNILDKETAIVEMDAVVAQNLRTKNPFMHFVLSWKEHEKPTKSQAIDAGWHAIQSLGFKEHQVIIAGHKDTQNYHIHIVINRIHPQTFKAHYPAWSHKTLSRAVHEIEIQQDWEHDAGIYSVVQVNNQKHIVLTPKQKKTNNLNGSPSKMEQHTGLEAFKTFVRNKPAEYLKSVLKEPGATWQDLHSALTKYNLQITTKGSGFIIRDNTELHLTIKASEASRLFSKSKLEKQFGEFEAPTVSNTAEIKKRYRDPGRRTKIRLIKEIEREDLYQRYLLDRNHLVSQSKKQKAIAWAKQKDTEKQRYEIFRRDIKQFKQETYATSDLPKKLLIGLIARERALRKEVLDKDIKQERDALKQRLERNQNIS